MEDWKKRLNIVLSFEELEKKKMIGCGSKFLGSWKRTLILRFLERIGKKKKVESGSMFLSVGKEKKVKCSSKFLPVGKRKEGWNVVLSFEE